MNASEQRQIRVWDLPVRLSHWALVLLMVMLFITAYIGQMDAHAALGRMALVLVIFRLIWGFIGSQNARFNDFVKGMDGIRAYLSSGTADTVGHNPVGALMVMVLLGAVLLQALSGLFCSDALAYSGPLAHWISSTASHSITRWHSCIAYAMAALVTVHVLAVLAHGIWHGENLIAPMVSGKKWVSPKTAQPFITHPAIAAVVIVLVTAVVVASTRAA